jgi:hypothetical protein
MLLGNLPLISSGLVSTTQWATASVRSAGAALPSAGNCGSGLLRGASWLRGTGAGFAEDDEDDGGVGSGLDGGLGKGLDGTRIDEALVVLGWPRSGARRTAGSAGLRRG